MGDKNISKLVPFYREDIRKYLDNSIDKWIEKRVESEIANDEREKIFSKGCIEALQTVKKDLFGGIEE